MHSEILSVVSGLKNLKYGSEYYNKLVSHGIPQKDLDQFIIDGNSLKSHEFKKSDIKRDVCLMFDLGGWIAGGGALSRIFKTHKPKDYDVFFNDPLTYAQAVIAMRKSPGIDVCYSPGKSYSEFDLSISKCSFRQDEFDIDESCLNAIESGVSDICPHAIINADATLRRMLKYHSYTNVKFHQEQVLAMCSVFPINKILAGKVLQEVTILLK